MCVQVCAHGCWCGMGASSVGKLGLYSLILKMFKHPGVTNTPLLDALWHSHGAPTPTPRHHGNKWCGCVDTAALFSTLRVLLPRAPLLIWAHLPPRVRHIKFLFQHWSGEGVVVNRLWQCKSDVPQRLPGAATFGQATLFLLS